MDTFTLKQLRYFAAVAAHESVTEAAKALYVSQPGVSSAIRQLEDLLHVQLFIRRKAQGMYLTPAGRELFASVRDLIAHADDVMASGRGLNDSVTGALKLGSFDTVGPYVLPRILARYSHTYSNVSVDVVEGNLAELGSALENGDIELALLYDLDLRSEVERCCLLELPPYIIAAAESPIAARASVSLAALVDEPMIMLDLPHSREYFSALFQRYQLRPRISHRVKSIPMVRSMVANGIGYSILNFRPQVKASYDGGRLAYIEIQERFPSLKVVLAWRHGARLTRRARAFVETARACIRPEAARAPTASVNACAR